MMRKFVATLSFVLVIIAAAYAATVEMTALKLDGSSSGAITLQAVATAGSNTITVPARTSTLATTTGTLTSGDCAQFDASGNLTAAGAACGTGGGTPANPSATAGPTAVNGSASTYMRSDGAPAVQKASNAQFGLAEGDGQTITCVLGVCSGTAPNSTKTANYTIASTDMGGQVNYNGSSITATIPAISSTVLASGMSVVITNRHSTALTLSTTPTINGFSGTSIPQYGGIACVSNGTSLDCVGLGTLAALGTPTSLTLTNATGLPVSTGVSGLGTGVATAAAANLSAAGGLSTTVASGTSALGTSAISSATCATAVTTGATNTATTDVISWGFNGDPTAVTGYVPLTAGMLTIIAYPSAGNVNFKVCNNTSSSVTPGAITLNWRVVR